MFTWQTVATLRGFEDNGNYTWTAPNGQVVAEGFVRAHCRPEIYLCDMVMADLPLPTSCQRWDLRAS